MKAEQLKQVVLTLNESDCSKVILLLEKGISQIGDNLHGQKTVKFGEELITAIEDAMR